jgi:hypothetical protein
MKWLEVAISEGQQREYLREAVEYASPRFEFETRINAMQLLRKLNYLDKEAAGYLIDGYLYWNYKVSHAAEEVILYFYQQNKGRSVIDHALMTSSIAADEKIRMDRLLRGK